VQKHNCKNITEDFFDFFSKKSQTYKKQFDVKEIIIIVLTQPNNQQTDPHNVAILIMFCE
jgi:hypothetical protein